ncbi:motile sperm domain-containing protein 2-like [Ornithodoros turicata]|uniref:motile sperm domain-containing protein 2-like n=1 Tax=Ornithodoros turicata TaxID=34597 RepID=UPI00313879C4
MPFMHDLENDVFGEEKYWVQVTPEQIRDLRQHFLDTWNEEDDLYYPDDVKRLRESDDFCRRVITHVRLDMTIAHKLLNYSLKWRKFVNIQDVKEEKLMKEIFQRAALFPYNKDKCGCHILMLRLKLYSKNLVPSEELKQTLLFFLEKMYNEIGAKRITMLFDCTDAGIGNVDLDMVRFILNTFLKRYPLGMGYVIVYDMPWLFTAAWKIIKGWLIPEAAARIKMVNKDQIKEYIDEKNLPVRMGGKDEYEYEYKPGNPLGDRCPGPDNKTDREA